MTATLPALRVPTSHPRTQHSHGTQNSRSRVHCVGSAVEMSYPKSRVAQTAEDTERLWFADMLWRAFPEAGANEALLCRLVAEYLTEDENRPVHAKTVKNWLRRNNAPHFRYVMKILPLAGLEMVLQFLDPETKGKGRVAR